MGASGSSSSKERRRKKKTQARCYTAAVMTHAASAISASRPGLARLASPSDVRLFEASKLTNAYLSCHLRPVSAVTAVTPVASTVQDLLTAHIFASATFFFRFFHILLGLF